MRRTLILYLALITALPVALLATVLPVNSYQAEGIDALDCDGPASVLLFAIPALLIYGAGAILLYRKRNRRLHLVASLCCASSSAPSAGMPLRRYANPMGRPRSKPAADPRLLCEIPMKPTAFACTRSAVMKTSAWGTAAGAQAGRIAMSNRRDR